MKAKPTVGQKVRFTAGPHRGHTGRVRSVARTRAWVDLDAARRMSFNAQIADLEPVS